MCLPGCGVRCVELGYAKLFGLCNAKICQKQTHLLSLAAKTINQFIVQLILPVNEENKEKIACALTASIPTKMQSLASQQEMLEIQNWVS